ncbi:unnamed protein product [Gongylonema pulchrum]|uniref:Ovule protein n=1 Tax=Gongylonema pulchrum TaxID=637853 RepID=A0A183CZD9_9BILA|nr:unnamed protein product [Gongylonema pulchrum]
MLMNPSSASRSKNSIQSHSTRRHDSSDSSHLSFMRHGDSEDFQVIGELKEPSAALKPILAPNTSEVPGINIPTVWSYSALFHHLPVPYSSLAPNHPPF